MAAQFTSERKRKKAKNSIDYLYQAYFRSSDLDQKFKPRAYSSFLKWKGKKSRARITFRQLGKALMTENSPENASI